MADDPITGGEGTEIAALGLDISPYVAELRKALAEYLKFANNFSKSLTLRIDPQSMQGLSNAFGVQMRQALKDINKLQDETVKQSVSTARKITAAYGNSYGMKGFKDLTKQVRAAQEEAGKEVSKLGQKVIAAANAANNAINQITKKGSDSTTETAANAVRGVAEAQKIISQFARGEHDRALRGQKALDERLAAAKNKGVPDSHIAAAVPDATVPLNNLAGKLFVNRDQLKEKLAGITAAMNGFTTSGIQAGGALDRLAGSTERIGARFDTETARFNKMSKSAQARTLELLATRRQAILAEEGDKGRSEQGTLGPLKLTSLEHFAQTLQKDEGSEPITRLRQRQVNALRLSREQAASEEKANEKESNRVQGEYLKEQRLENTVNKAHGQALKMRAKERAAELAKTVNASQDDAIAMLRQESIVNKAHGQAISMLSKERRDAVAKLAANELASNKAQQVAINMRSREALATSKAQTVAQNMLAAGQIPGVSRLAAGLPGQTAAQNNAAQARRLVGGPPGLPPTTTPPAPGGGYPAANAGATQLLGTHKNLGLSIAQQAVNIGKWLFFYKAVHEITNAIQKTVSTFLREGIAYNREQEQLTLALRGILAENYTITDQQGKQLSGLAALNALQKTSKSQWRQIQEASLSVVGTTADLMGLYEGILPFASNLGANLDRVQSITKGTAVAASLLNVSFQDARSAMVGLLQGRALTRNRLVGALGFTKEEISSLKGTPALLDAIETRLDSFLALSDDAAGTLASLSESFKDFTGIIAGSFTQPLVELFKSFVKELTKSGSAFALFEKSASGFGLQLTPQLQGFLAFTQAVFQQLADDAKDWAKTFAGNLGAADVQRWVVGIEAGFTGVLHFATGLAAATVAIANFAAGNRALFKALGWAAVLLVGVGVLQKFYFWSNSTFKITSALGGAMNVLTGNLGQYAAGTAKAGQQMTRMSFVGGKLVSLFASLGTSLVVGGLLFALEKVITKMLRAQQVAESAKAAIDHIGKGDFQRGAANVSDTLESDQLGVRVGGVAQLFLGMEKDAQDLKAKFNNDLSNENVARVSGKNFTDQTATAKELDAANKELAAAHREAAAATREAVTFNTRPGEDTPAVAEAAKKLEEITAALGEYNAHLEALKEKETTNREIDNQKAGQPSGLSAYADRLTETIAGLNQTITGQSDAVPAALGKFEEIIQRNATTQNVPADLIRAIIRQESNFNPQAVSSKDAHGLMQLLPGTAKDMGLTGDIHDPEANIKAGTKYLAKLLEMFQGDLAKVLAAYNAGPAAVVKHGGVPPFKETKNYVSRVQGFMAEGSAPAQADLVRLTAERDARLKELNAVKAQLAAANATGASQSLSTLTAEETDLQDRIAALQGEKALAEKALLAVQQSAANKELVAARQQRTDIEEENDKLETTASRHRSEAEMKESAARLAAAQARVKAAEAAKGDIADRLQALKDEDDKSAKILADLTVALSMRDAVRKALVVPERGLINGVFGSRSLESPVINRRLKAQETEKAPVAYMAAQLFEQLKTKSGLADFTKDSEHPTEDAIKLEEILVKLFADAIGDLRKNKKPITLNTIVAQVARAFDAKTEQMQAEVKRIQGIYDVSQVDLAPTPTEDQDKPPRPDFAPLAPTLIKRRESEDSLEIARVENLAARRVSTEAAAQEQIRGIDDKFAKYRIEKYQEDYDAYLKYVAQRERLSHVKGSGVTAISDKDQEKAAQELLTNVTDAWADLDRKAVQADTERVKRTRDLNQEFESSLIELSGRTGQIFGVAEDTALASFDKAVKAIKDRLGDLAGTPQDHKNIDTVLGMFAARRPEVATSSRAQESVKNTEKSLEIARSEHSLLLQQLEAGEVGATNYLNRVREIRATQAGLLKQQIESYQILARQREKAIELVPTDPTIKSPEEAAARVAGIKIEVQQLNDQVSRSTAELARLMSQAARVELASQAWDNLTGQIREFLSVADGLNAVPHWMDGLVAGAEKTNTGLMDIIGTAQAVLSMLDRIKASSMAFARIPKAFNAFRGFLSDVKTQGPGQALQNVLNPQTPEEKLSGVIGKVGIEVNAASSAITNLVATNQQVAIALQELRAGWGRPESAGVPISGISSNATFGAGNPLPIPGTTPKVSNLVLPELQKISTQFHAGVSGLISGLAADAASLVAQLSKTSKKATGSDTASAVTTSAAKTAEQIGGAAGKVAKAIPYIGIGISVALAVGTAMWQAAVAKAKKRITETFDSLAKSIQTNHTGLADQLDLYQKQRAQLVAQYSKSKSGRAALKELLPEIDKTIDSLVLNIGDKVREFDEQLKRVVDFSGKALKKGMPFTDFYLQLVDLDKFVTETMANFKKGTKAYDAALKDVRRYTDAFFESARNEFKMQMLGFEGEALAAQERVFSLINETDGLYTQLRDVAESRTALEESIADEQERRAKGQDKLNDLIKKELDLRKQIAEVIRQANEDELSIRRRGVLEAQLSIAQQKAVEISNVRHKAADEVAKLKDELAHLHDDVEDETKLNARKDRDFGIQARNLNEREAEIRKAMRLNSIRLSGAKQVAAIEGSMFGMAADEYDLAGRQSALDVQNATLQVEKWRETAALVEAIKKNADGFFFDPPAGFPQIKVDLGNFTIDNTDNSTNIFNPDGGSTPAPTGPNGRPLPDGPRGGGGTGPSHQRETSSTAIGNDGRTGGYGDVY